MWPHWKPCGGAVGHARTGVGVSLVGRVGVVEPEGGRGAGLDHDQSRWHGNEYLAPAIIGDFGRFSSVRGGVQLQLWIALNTASSLADVDDEEGNTMVAGGGVSTRTVCGHRELAGRAGGDRGRGQRGGRLSKRQHSS